MAAGERFCPGRYAAIDVGSNSVLLLIADVDEDGKLTQLAEGAAFTRLSERFFVSQRLTRPARDRTLHAIGEFVRVTRRARVENVVAVGTSVLREAGNAGEFLQEVWQKFALPVEVISGEQEAELAYLGNVHDRTLPGTDGERIVLDVGGGSTEIVRGLGGTILNRVSYPMGAARLTQEFLQGDPPSGAECAAAEAAIEQALSEVEPAPAGSLLLASGGTISNLASVARAAGMLPPGEIHGRVLQHRRVAELADLFRTLPIKFRKRVPGLEPERSEVIFGGAMILHQLMARLSASGVVVSGNGVRHGCIYRLAERALQRP